MEGTDKIREAGLKLTPQRKAVYEAMTKDKEITLSTVYRILDSFCKAGLLSLVCHPDTGKCYYDITVHSHHHLFNGQQIMDYEDPELTRMIQQYLESKNLVSDDIDKIQVQITLNKCLTKK